MRVQGSAWVGVLLGHRPCRHIHGVCLLWVLRSCGRDQAGLAMCGWSHHPGTALHYWTEHMLRLGLVVWHLLDQRLTGELLRAAGEVLGRVGGARCYNGWSRCRRWVHHGGRARWVVLIRPLLGHVGYFTWSVGFRLADRHMRYWNLVHGWRLHSRTDWCKGVHLGEADRLAVHSWGLLDHDGGARLTLGPRGCGGVGWFGLCIKPGFELIGIWVQS